MQHRPYNNGTPGFLGPAHAPFKPEGEGKHDLMLNGITLDGSSDRKPLLASFDSFRRDADASGMMDGIDAFTAAGVRHADLEPAGRGARPREGRPARSRALRHGHDRSTRTTARRG